MAAGVFALDLFLPPRCCRSRASRSITLPSTPGCPNSSVSLAQRRANTAKTRIYSQPSAFWFSADSAFGGVDWGFAVTVSDLLRFLLLSILFGFYFALIFHYRQQETTAGWSSTFSRGGGASGALASVLGVSTGGCTVMGCGAPMLPVVGLAFVGLSSGTLALLAELSRVATTLVFIAVTLGVLYFGWLAGARVSQEPPP